jgi:S-adenosylmethionine hydrolase
MSAPPPIALITDFGIEDSYAGVLRGVLSAADPRLCAVDITHSIPFGDVRRAGLVLWEAQPFFPRGTVFLVVVDPGVGGPRKGLIVQFSDCLVVCPDNGLITYLTHRFTEWHATEISNPAFRAPVVSQTFHGRDIFAPAAARLALGTPVREFGAGVKDPVRLSMPRLAGCENTGWEGEVLYADHFGNAITSLGIISTDGRRIQPWFPSGADKGTLGPQAHVVLEDGTRAPVARAYGEGRQTGSMAAVAGSSGLLEVAAYQASAAAHPSLKTGCIVRLIP